jgi:hypothetical protein
MFTTLNVVCLLFIYPNAPPAIKDILRGTTLIILLMVVTIWLSGYLFEVYDDLYVEFAEPLAALPMKFAQQTEFGEPVVALPMKFAQQTEFGEPILSINTIIKNKYNHPLPVKRTILLIGDILFHVLPGHLIGLPTNPVSVLIAYCITLLWFFLNRDRITKIYSRTVTKKRVEKSLVFTGIMALVFVLFLMF